MPASPFVTTSGALGRCPPPFLLARSRSASRRLLLTRARRLVAQLPPFYVPERMERDVHENRVLKMRSVLWTAKEDGDCRGSVPRLRRI